MASSPACTARKRMESEGYRHYNLSKFSTCVSTVRIDQETKHQLRIDDHSETPSKFKSVKETRASLSSFGGNNIRSSVTKTTTTDSSLHPLTAFIVLQAQCR